MSHFVSNSSNINTILLTTHCCSRGGSRSAAAGEGRRGRGGEATEDEIGRAGGFPCGAAAYLTASVRLALAGSKTRQRLADGYRSALRESLWTVPIFRQWPLSFRACHRSADKSLRDFLKGRHGDFLRGVYRVVVASPVISLYPSPLMLIIEIVESGARR